MQYTIFIDHDGQILFWTNGCSAQWLSKYVFTVSFHGHNFCKDQIINHVKTNTIWSCHFSLTQCNNFENNINQTTHHKANIINGIIADRLREVNSTTYPNTFWYCHKINNMYDPLIHGKIIAIIAIAHETNNVNFPLHKFITGNEVNTNQIAAQTKSHNK